MNKDKILIKILKLTDTGKRVGGQVETEPYRHGWNAALDKVIEVIEQEREEG